MSYRYSFEPNTSGIATGRLVEWFRLMLNYSRPITHHEYWQAVIQESARTPGSRLKPNGQHENKHFLIWDEKHAFRKRVLKRVAGDQRESHIKCMDAFPDEAAERFLAVVPTHHLHHYRQSLKVYLQQCDSSCVLSATGFCSVLFRI